MVSCWANTGEVVTGSVVSCTENSSLFQENNIHYIEYCLGSYQVLNTIVKGFQRCLKQTSVVINVKFMLEEEEPLEVLLQMIEKI